MLLTRTADALYDALLSIVYPQSCAICGSSVDKRSLGVACPGCWTDTRVFQREDTVCWKCGALSRGAIVPEKVEQVRCRRCDEATFAAARACGVYEGALRASVLALKHQPYISRRLIGMLFEIQQRAPLNSATRIIPVPLHPQREKVRGFNQAAVIGRQLARRARLPFDEVSLMRTSHSERHRAGMDARGRRETVEKAFAVRYPRLVADEHILIVDDVFTTGATASSCASTLMAAGAKEVVVLTVARSPN